jgi:DNA primase
MALNFSESKKIPITEYLSRLGIEPAKVRGNDYWYRSPFRSENDASFKVNVRLNLWYDHGSGEGGTILDLGAKINSCSVVEFLTKLEGQHFEPYQFSFQRKQESVNENKLTISTVNHLNDQALIEYLKTRGISREMASEHCLEAKFRIGNKEYQAIAFQNQSGGFELRNNWFKGSSSPKDISYFNSDSGRLCVLEGFIDFLSLKQMGKDVCPAITGADFLILNSLSFLARNLELLKDREAVSLFLDNDPAGIRAKSQIESAGVRFDDQSKLYRPFKDVNEFLMNSHRTFGKRTTIKL